MIVLWIITPPTPDTRGYSGDSTALVLLGSGQQLQESRLKTTGEILEKPAYRAKTYTFLTLLTLLSRPIGTAVLVIGGIYIFDSEEYKQFALSIILIFILIRKIKKRKRKNDG